MSESKDDRLSVENFSSDPKIREEVLRLAYKVALELNNINQGSLHLPVYRRSPNIKPYFDELYDLYKSVSTGKSAEELVKAVPHLEWVVPLDQPSIDSLLGGMIALDVMITRPGIDYYATHSDELEIPIADAFAIDRYGLIKVDGNLKLTGQGIIINDDLVYYHPFLRRFFQARFVDTPAIIAKVYSQGAVELKVALDPIRHTSARRLDGLAEFDYWYGAHFDVARLNELGYEGVTVHGRNDITGRLDATFPLLKTVFYIKDYNNGEKEFQIEEIVPTDSRVSSGKKYVLHRFAHFIWSKEKHTFRHFDCAVLVYDKKEHKKRLLYDWKSLDESGYAQTYKRKKLFRLDGKIEVETVKDLLYSFFRYNELVMEYFGAVPEGLEETPQTSSSPS